MEQIPNREPMSRKVSQ